MEKQTDIETKIQMSYEELTELQQDLLNTDENIKNRLTKLPEDFKASASILLDRTSTLDRKMSTTEGRTEVMVIRLDEYSEKLENFRSNVDTLSNYVDNIKPIIDYTGPKVRELDIQVRNLQTQNTGMYRYLRSIS